MIKLHTSVGRYELRVENGSKQPVIVANNKEYTLTMYEMLLWSKLTWHINTKDELKIKFNSFLQETGAADENINFERIFNRLKTRDLIVSGQGYTGIDALYNLFSRLVVVPVSSRFHVKVIAFFNLLLKGNSFSVAIKVFSSVKLTPDEKFILNLAHKGRISAVDVIRVINRLEGEAGENKTEEDAARFHEQRLSVLKSIAELYEKRMILFDRKEANDETT